MISLWQGIIRNGKNSWQVFHSRNRRECLREGPGPGSCLREAPEAGPAPSPAILGMRQVCSSSWKCISYLTGNFFLQSPKKQFNLWKLSEHLTPVAFVPGPVKTTGISYDLDGKFSFTKVTFLYITSQLFDYHLLDHEAWSAQPIPDRCHWHLII